MILLSEVWLFFPTKFNLVKKSTHKIFNADVSPNVRLFKHVNSLCWRSLDRKKESKSTHSSTVENGMSDLQHFQFR